MKKMYMTMVAMLCAATAMAQIGSLSCADVNLEAGNTAYIEVKLSANDVTAISGIGFNMLLPKGVTVAQYYNEDDEEWVDDVTFPIAKAKHQTGYQAAADGSLLVWCAGDNSVSFRTTTDVVMKMGVTVPKEFTNGVYEIKFYNIALSDKSDPVTPVSFPVDDFTAKLTVTGGSVPQPTDIGTLTCADVNLEAGNTAYIEVKLSANDVSAISGIGFNMLLPKGVTVAQYYNEEDEEWVDDVTFPIAKAKHQTGYQTSVDGSLLVWCAGDNTLSFRTTTDIVMKMGVTVPKNFANGEYAIKFYNVGLSGKSDPVAPASFPVDDFTAKLTVTGGSEPQPQPQLTCAFTADNIEADAGGATTYMEVKLATEDITAISGIQFKFSLPEGISIAQKNVDGDMVDDVTFPIAKSNHQVGIWTTSDGGYLVVLGGDNSLSFKTTTDVVAKIGLAVAKTVKSGTYDINFVKVAVSDKSNPVKSYDVADFSSKLTVTGAEPEPISEDTDISKLDNVIYLEKIEGFVGSTATLSFKMKNKDVISAFSFDLYLPEGVTPVKKNNCIQAKLSSGRVPDGDEDALLFNQPQPNGPITFLCNLQNGEFTGDDGEIFSMTVNIANDKAAGDYPIVMKEMKLTNKSLSDLSEQIPECVQSTLSILPFMLGDVNGDHFVNLFDYVSVSNYILSIPQSVFIIGAGDVTGDGVVDLFDYVALSKIILLGSPNSNGNNQVKPAYVKANVTDISTIENVIYMESLEVAAGTQATLSFHLKNNDEIRAFSFDLYLPEGITVKTRDKYVLTAKLSDERLPEYSSWDFLGAVQDDGAIRFLCNSKYGDPFTGNEGEIFTMQVDVPENMKKGDYPVEIKEILLSDVNNESKGPGTDFIMESTIKVIGGTGIADILEGDDTAVIYNLSGQRLAKPQQGINIIKGKKVMLK